MHRAHRPARHVEFANPQPEGFADAFKAAKVMLLGYPVWWGGTLVMDAFVTGNDFACKTVYPFCVLASSPQA